MQSLKQQHKITIPYWPHTKQIQFHLDRYNIRYRLLSGGTGSGKTLCGVWEMLSYLIDDNPGSVGFIFEPSFPMVRRNLIAQGLEKLLGKPISANPLVKTFMKTEHRIDFINGSRLWFGSLEEPEYAEGSNCDFIMVDEARLIRKFDEAWKSIMRRLRSSGKTDRWTGAYVTTTPDQPGSELHTFFENPKTKHPHSKVYRMAISDNIHLPSYFLEDIKLTHHGGYAESFIYGRFAAVGAGTIPFDSTVHVVSFIDVSTLKQVLYGCDFGFTNPACILAVGFDGDGRAYVLSEFYERRVMHTDLAEQAKLMQSQFGRGRFYCDRSQPETIEQFKSLGIRAEGSKAKRDESIRELAGRFLKAGDGKPRIFIASECVNLIAELQTYDETVKENDHAVDALRYALASKMKKKVKPAGIFLGPEHRPRSRNPWRR